MTQNSDIGILKITKFSNIIVIIVFCKTVISDESVTICHNYSGIMHSFHNHLQKISPLAGGQALSDKNYNRASKLFLRCAKLFFPNRHFFTLWLLGGNYSTPPTHILPFVIHMKHICTQ
jgi:hypothetical protein